MTGAGPGSATADFERALLELDRVGAAQILARAVSETDPFGAVDSLVVPALERIGVGWERGDVALAQIFMGGRICEELVDEWLPKAGKARPGRPRLGLAVLDDFHMLGKRMVYSVLRAAGYEVRDYGRMLAPELATRAEDDGVEILLLSVLMLPSALRVRDLVERLPNNIRVAVGGAPFRFDAELHREIGADAVGRSASDAVGIVKRLTERAA